MFAATASCYKVLAFSPALSAPTPVGVDEGLGRFTYLTGRSGRRYMFCRVSRDQASLYGDCVYAVESAASNAKVIAATLPDEMCEADPVFVHLPDGTSVNTVLRDLTGTDWQ